MIEPNTFICGDCADILKDLHEMAWTSFDHSTVKGYYFGVNGMLTESKDERVHPTQKPSELFIKILMDYSKPGDLIIDPFCGSGTTALACHKTGRRFICIDKDQEYINIAKRRYREFIAQGSLFASVEIPKEPEQLTAF